MSNVSLDELLAKQAINDVLARYCRGLDRMDKALAYSVFHPQSTAIYAELFKGSGHGFIDWVFDTHADLRCHSHQICNVLAEVEGDQAVSEAYVTVVLWTQPDERGKQLEVVGRGRYLDQWSNREGVWAIDHREHLLDMQNFNKLSPGPNISVNATRDRSDASYAYFK